MNGWIAALRIARRDAMRAKGRSMLIVLMILAPVTLMTFADVNARSTAPSEYATARDQVADADLTMQKFDTPIASQDYKGSNLEFPEGIDEPKPLPGDITTLFGPGATVTEDREVVTSVETPDGVERLYLRGLDVSQGPNQGLYTVKDGRMAANEREIAINTVTAEKTDKKIGDTIVLPAGNTTMTVVGIIENPRALKDDVGVTAAIPASLQGNSDYETVTYRVDLGGNTFAWDDVKTLNDYGLTVLYPEFVLDPPAEAAAPVSNGSVWQVYGVLILIGGLAALEICLLAGTAFAVGARRQRRSLALVAASGGTTRQVRNIVLSTGIVLGVVASVLGLAAGIGLAALFQPLVEEQFGRRFVEFAIRPMDLAIIAALGLATAVLSAVVPARAATKMNVPAALAGRPDPVHAKGRHVMPIFGGILFVLGAVVLALGATQRNLTVIMAGAVLAEIGLVLLTSKIVGLIGKIGGKLPLTPRMALRDAVRNRPRTTPAVAAIMAGVAGATSVSMFVLAYGISDREDYQPRALAEQVIVPLDNFGLNQQQQATQVKNLEEQLRGIAPLDNFYVRNQLTLGEGADPMHSLNLHAPAGSVCADTWSSGYSAANTSCFDTQGFVVGDENTLQTLTGAASPAALQALSEGKILVTDERYLTNGNSVIVAVDDYETSTPTTVREEALPAIAFEDGVQTADRPLAYFPQSVADELGLASAEPYEVVLTPSAPVTDSQFEAIDELVALSYQGAYVERGYQDGYRIGILILAIASTVLALLATAIATGLALADGAADQSTLSAVGASPTFRRTMSAFQAVVVSLIGVGLGLLSGLLPGAAFAWFSRYQLVDGSSSEYLHRPVPWLEVIPWTNIAMLIIAVPLLAGVAAFVFTRSKVSISRRAAV